MRWIERLSGLLAGLLAIVAGALAFQLHAVRILTPVSCGDSCTQSSVEFGPGVDLTAHSAIMPPVAIIVVAALALAAVALLDTRRPAHSRFLSALTWLAVILCAIGVGMLLAGNIDVEYNTTNPLPPAGLLLQYNAGALFMPALLAAFVCAIAAIWPRRPAQPALARAAR